MDNKLDLSAVYPALYKPSKTIHLVKVPALNYIMVDGVGNPNTSASYSAAIQALYSLSYTLKFANKFAGGLDYRVMPLESLWEGPAGSLISGNKDDWSWTAMILQPPLVTAEAFELARTKAYQKNPSDSILAARLESYEEGECVQVLYIGPWAEESHTIEAMRAFAAERGYRPRLRHHEIYLSDPRRVAPEKLKTIIRQPIEPL